MDRIAFTVFLTLLFFLIGLFIILCRHVYRKLREKQLTQKPLENTKRRLRNNP
jgi:hypothetical protein